MSEPAMEPAKEPAMERPPELERLFEGDALLRQYEADILQRWGRYRHWERRIGESEGGLAQFARGYEDWGIVQRAGGEVTVREWVDNGAEVAVVGDFNGWDRSRHVCARGDFGVFSLTIPPLADGSPAVPHGSQVKLWIRTRDGQELYRLSPWTKYATQVRGSVPYTGREAQYPILGERLSTLYWVRGWFPYILTFCTPPPPGHVSVHGLHGHTLGPPYSLPVEISPSPPAPQLQDIRGSHRHLVP